MGVLPNFGMIYQIYSNMMHLCVCSEVTNIAQITV